MKVLLIHPPSNLKETPVPLIGLGYIASYLEKEHHKVKIIDSLALKYTFEDVLRDFKKFDPDIVGLTAFTIHLETALSLARHIKKINPNCIVVLGGSHPTVRAKETLKENPEIDIIVRNEGELTFLELVNKLEKQQDLSYVKGINFRKNKKIVNNPDRKPINLDDLPMPAFHLLPMEKYASGQDDIRMNDRIFGIRLFGKQGQTAGLISTSRGCPFNCVFCAAWKVMGDKWRGRSAENVFDELKLLKDKYKLRVIDFADDTFSLDKKRTEKICNLIKKEDLDILWSCSTRVDLFDKKTASLFKETGCYRVTFGLESGNQKTLDFFRKGITLEDSIRAVKITKEFKLQANSNFIIGVPGETRSDILNTINFARKLKLAFNTFSILTPYPGTQIYEYAKKHDLLLSNDWTKYHPGNSILKTGLTNRELRGFLIKANVLCNIGKSNISKILKKM